MSSRAVLLAAFLSVLVPASSYATDYTWTGASSTGWTTAGNWTPSGPPTTAADTAIFTGTPTRSCLLTSAVSIGGLTLDGTFTSTITLVGSGDITASAVSIGAGTIISGTDRVSATGTLAVSGGTLADLTADGSSGTCGATISGGTIGVLRMTGTTTLAGVTGTPQTLTSLTVPTGTCTLSNSFVAGLLSIAAPATLELASLSTLTTTGHTIGGTLKLLSGSAMIFATNASITAGTIDASAPGSAVVCNGDWVCTGSYLTSGGATNALTIIQGVTGTTVNHGTNPADVVVVQNDVGRTTTWNSTNTAVQLTVAADSTFAVGTGSVFSVGPITNAGTMQENSPGHIHHVADALEPVNEALIVISNVPAGASFRARLRDADEGLSATLVDNASGIRVTNPRNGDFVDLVGAESGVTTTLYVTPSIPTADAGPAVGADGVLQVLAGDTLSLTYIDNEDAADNAGAASLPVVASTRVDGWSAY